MVRKIQDQYTDAGLTTQQRWYRRNKVKAHSMRKSHMLKFFYGITLKDYYDLLEKQNGVCAICKSDDPGNKRIKYFHVDHCHKTNKVRGLLCNFCNRGLGDFKDSLHNLQNAFVYLKEAYSV